MKDTYIPEVAVIMFVLGMVGFAMLVQGCISTQTLVVPTEQNKDCAAVFTTIGVTEWVTLHEEIEVECYHVSRDVQKTKSKTSGGPISHSSNKTNRGAVSE